MYNVNIQLGAKEKNDSHPCRTIRVSGELGANVSRFRCFHPVETRRYYSRAAPVVQILEYRNGFIVETSKYEKLCNEGESFFDERSREKQGTVQGQRRYPYCCTDRLHPLFFKVHFPGASYSEKKSYRHFFSNLRTNYL